MIKLVGVEIHRAVDMIKLVAAIKLIDCSEGEVVAAGNVNECSGKGGMAVSKCC